MTNKSKHILITGASSGIGQELARQLLGKGHRLSLIARREIKKSDLSAETISESRLLTIRADVADPESMKNAVIQAETELGPIDIVIANAGVAHHTYAPSPDLALVKDMIDTNLLGVIHTVAAVAPLFLARGRGHIVGISSLTSYMSTTHYSVYGATKAAVSSYLNSLRLELASSNILVTVICPGFIKTPMTDDNSFKMPFLLEVEEAARKIIRSVESEVELSNFPQPVYRSIQAINALPSFLSKRILKAFRF